MNGLERLRGTVSRRTMRQQITEQLAYMIAAGILRVGEDLPSARDLAELLDVSRETVRGAVKSLADRGMIEIAHGTRARIIRSPQMPGVLAHALLPGKYAPRDVFHVRSLLESDAARSAALLITPERKARLRELAERQKSLLSDPVAYLISDTEFHRMIYTSCGNKFTADLLDLVYGDSVRKEVRPNFSREDYLRSIDNHFMIVDALDRGDGNAASAAMAHHLHWVHQANYRD